MEHQNVEIMVGLGERSYSIQTGPKLLDAVGEKIRELGFLSPIAVITDHLVGTLYGDRILSSLRQAGYQAEMLTFPAGEPSKTLATVGKLYDGMVTLGPERKSGIVALGGGVAGDLAGFVAATYLRGIRFVQVPTTLLAQVDAAVGGKVGFDHAGGKNLIGAFHQPSLVLIDTETLNTLDRRQILAGLAEIIKHGIIADADLFHTVESRLKELLHIQEAVYRELIPWNCRIKAGVIEKDEKELGLRAILNFGHTIGHAIESLTEYKQYLHGEAVALGMWVEAELGNRLGITPRDVVAAITAILHKAGFPLQKPELSAEQLVQAMFHDKKVEQKTLRFIFPTQIGKVVIHPVREIHRIQEVWDTIFT